MVMGSMVLTMGPKMVVNGTGGRYVQRGSIAFPPTPHVEAAEGAWPLPCHCGLCISFPHTPFFHTTERRTSMVLLPSPLRAFAMVVAVSSSLFVVFTLTAWLTVAQDAQLMSEQNSDDSTGVSLHCFMACDGGARDNRARYGSYGLLDTAIDLTWKHENCPSYGN